MGVNPMTSQANEYYLAVHHVTKKYGSFVALDDVSFSMKPGEFLTILGPSGCGKTTLLRVVAGLDPQSAGQVLIDSRDVSHLPVSKRNIGIVFQSYALFPNLTAEKNVSYGLAKLIPDKNKRRDRVAELLELVGLKGFGPKYPAQLSGGQQQRVALARALALSPKLLLLDEPLSALDAKVRVHLRTEIRQLQKRLGLTTIMVTHDQEEALTMADQILVIDQGLIAQQGSPIDIYDKPATPFVASFVGSMNFIANAVKKAEGVCCVGDIHLEVHQEYEPVPIAPGQNVTIAIRPEDIVLRNNGGARPNMLEAQVQQMEYRGSLYRLYMDLPLNGGTSAPIKADVSAEQIFRLNIQNDSQVGVQFPAERIRVYEER
jgi:iron(III) transport system ATP-binding protein